MVNVGCDETFDIGQGRSKQRCEQQGNGVVYLEFLLSIYKDLKRRGCTMQFWGDIVNQHPELLPYLPRDLVALEWGYEADHPFAENTARYATAGIPFYVCPGTSSWSSLAGRTDNALQNLLRAAESGLENGAIGYLITDWGDNGHWQFLPVSYLGFAAGAAYAWAFEPNRDLNLPAALDRFAFRDRGGVIGRLAYDLGNIYRSLEIDWANASALFSILQRSLQDAAEHPKIRRIPFDSVLAEIDRALVSIDEARMDRPDGELIRDEYTLTARLLRHACRRGLLAQALAGGLINKVYAAELAGDLREIIAEFRRLWLARNRPGGQAESLARFEKARLDYRF
jgi:hexosaminidase